MKRPAFDVVAIARRELDDTIDWLRREADPETAERFVEAALRSFARLAEAPGLGSPVTTTASGLTGLRKWRVAGFPRTLIFYHTVEHGIRIVRVLHASQDWPALIDPR